MHNHLRDLIVYMEREFKLTDNVPFMKEHLEEPNEITRMGNILVDQFNSLPLKSKLAILLAFGLDAAVTQRAGDIQRGTTAMGNADAVATSKLKTTVMKVGLLVTAAILIHAFAPELIDADTRAMFISVMKTALGMN